MVEFGPDVVVAVEMRISSAATNYSEAEKKLSYEQQTVRINVIFDLQASFIT